MDNIPEYVRTAEEDDEFTEVTEDFEGTIELVTNLVGFGSMPIPISHAVAYTVEDSDSILFMFTVDTSDNIDSVYGFKLELEENLVNCIETSECDEGKVGEQVDVLHDKINHKKRILKEAIWSESVNI